MAGIVMMDLMGGDYAYAIVDNLRWQQISSLDQDDMPGEDDDERREVWQEAVLFLASDTDAAKPPGAPDPVGRVLETLYTQSGVIEPADFEGPITGFLSIRCS